MPEKEAKEIFTIVHDDGRAHVQWSPEFLAEMEEYDKKWTTKFVRLGYRIQTAYREILWRFRKLKRGWDVRDTWNLDCAFVDWILPRLRYMVDHINSVPVSLLSEENSILSNSVAYIPKKDDDRDKKVLQQWRQILQEMIDGFSDYQKQQNGDDINPDDEFATKSFETAMNHFHKYITELWD